MVSGDPLPKKEPFFERPPFGAVRNFDQGSVDRPFERTMLRECDRHVRGRKEALGYLESSGVALRNEILQRSHAIDDCVRLSGGQRIERFRQVLIFGVLQMQFVEILCARGSSYRC